MATSGNKKQDTKKGFSLPKIKAKFFEQRGVTSSGSRGYYRKGDELLASVESAVSQLTNITNSTPDNDNTDVRVVAVPTKNLPPTIPGFFGETKRKYDEARSKLGTNDVVVVVKTYGRKADEANRSGWYTAAFVMDAQEADNFLKNAQDRPDLVDKTIEAENEGVYTGNDLNPVPVNATQVTFWRNADLGGDFTENTPSQPVRENYRFNQPETYERVSQGIIDEPEEDEEQQSASEEVAEEIDTSPQASAPAGNMPDVVTRTELERSLAEGTAARDAQEKRLSDMRAQHRQAQLVLAELRQQVQRTNPQVATSLNSVDFSPLDQTLNQILVRGEQVGYAPATIEQQVQQAVATFVESSNLNNQQRTALITAAAAPQVRQEIEAQYAPVSASTIQRSSREPEITPIQTQTVSDQPETVQSQPINEPSNLSPSATVAVAQETIASTTSTPTGGGSSLPDEDFSNANITGSSGGGSTPPPSTPSPSQPPANRPTIVDSRELEKAALQSLDDARQFVDQTTRNVDQDSRQTAATQRQQMAVTDPTIQTFLAQSIKEASGSISQLRLDTPPENFQSVFERDVLNRLQQKVEADPILSQRLITKTDDPARQQQTVTLAPELADFARVGTSGAVNEYLKQQTRKGISSPSQQAAAAFPNLDQSIPATSAPTPQEFGNPASVAQRSTKEIVTEVLDKIPGNQLSSADRKKLTSALYQEVGSVLNTQTGYFIVQTDPATTAAQIQEKVQQAIQSNTSLNPADVIQKTTRSVTAQAQQYTEELRQSKESLFQNIQGQQESKTWTDPTNKVEEHLKQRAVILEKINDLKSMNSRQTGKIRATDVEALQTQLDQLDNEFFTKNPTVINSYQQSVSPQQATATNNSRFSAAVINVPEVENIFTEVSRGAPIPRPETISQRLQKSDTVVDRGVTTFAADLAKEIQEGKISASDAQKSFNQYLSSQQQIFGAMQNQSTEVNTTNRNWYTSAENLQNTIDRGSTVIEKAFEEANRQKIADIRYKNGKITKQEEEQVLIEIIGWKEYDKKRLTNVLGKDTLTAITEFVPSTDPELHEKNLKQIAKQLETAGVKFNKPQELEKYIATIKDKQDFTGALNTTTSKTGRPAPLDVKKELMSVLGETEDRRVTFRLQFLGLDNGELGVNDKFYKELARATIDIYKANPDAATGDVVAAYRNAYSQFAANLPNPAAFKLSDDEIRDIALKVVQDRKVQAAFAAAQSAPFIIPHSREMHDDLHERAIEKLLQNKTTIDQQQDTNLRVTYDQVFRDSIREDYVSMLTETLVSNGTSREQAKILAQKAVMAALGGTTQIDDGNGFAIENFGVLPNTSVKDFGYLHKLALEKMSPEERLAYIKEFPQYDAVSQRVKTITDALLKQLEADGVKLSKEEIEKLVKSTHAEELQKQMATLEASNTTIPAIKLMMNDPMHEWKGYLRTNFLERKIQQTFLQQGDYIMRWIPVNKVDKKALIMGQLFHPDKSSRSLEKEITRFIKINGKSPDDLQTILGGSIPQGYTLTQANTASVYAQKAKLHQWVADAQARHPKLTQAMIRWGKFLERDDVTIMRYLASGNPLERGFELVSNRVMNNILIGTGKWKDFDGNGQIENIFMRNLTISIEREKQFARDKAKRWFLQTTVGKALTGAKNAVVNLAKKLLSKLPTWLLKLGARAIPIIGQIYGALDFITGGLLTKVLKFLASLIVVSIVGFILGMLGWPIKIFGWIQQGAQWTGNVLANTTRALQGFNFSVNFNFINPAGWFSGALSGIQQTISILVNGGVAVQGFLANLATWTANFGAVGTAAIVTVGGSYVMVNMYHLFTIGTALKDAPPAVDASSVSSINPLLIQKSSNPTAIANNPTDPPDGDEITYSIVVKSPACAPTITVTDNLPANVIYVPGSISFQQPITPPITSIVTNDTTAPLLTWTINTEGGNAENCLAADGALDFRAGNDDITRALLTNLLSSSPQLRYFFLKDEVENFLTIGDTFGINGLGPVAIFYAESHLGEELSGQGIGAPSPVGCNNPGGLRVSGLPTCPPNSSGRSSGFSRFNSYSEAIEVVSRTIDNRLNDVQTQFSTGPNTNMTIEYLSSLYIPTSDPKNCSAWEPGVPTGSPIGCIAGFNAQWKRTVACTMVEKQLCTWPLETYLKFKNGAETPGTNIEQLSTVLTYKAVVTGGITEGCITNIATANMGTFTNRAQTTVTIGDALCSDAPPAPPDSQVIIDSLCDGLPGANGKTVIICPTVNRVNPPGTNIPLEYQTWTLSQLQALWNVAHKIAGNPNYANYVTGNYTVEITRSRCFLAEGKTYCPPSSKIKGYNSGQGSGWQTRPDNPKLIMITDNVVGFTNNVKALEWLYGHELGHSAQHGTIDGGIGGRDRNPAYAAYRPCYNAGNGEVVSSYGRWEPNPLIRQPETNYSENHADALSFYMTSGETAINGYAGGNANPKTGDIKVDYPCTYQSSRGPVMVDGRDVSFFGGKEYEP